MYKITPQWLFSGWGTIYFGGPVASTLQEVTIPIWPNDECDAAYEQDIIDKQMCAGAREGGKDSCQVNTCSNPAPFPIQK